MSSPQPPWSTPEWVQLIHERNPEAWQAIEQICSWKCRQLFPGWPADTVYDLSRKAATHIIAQILHGYSVRAMRSFVVRSAENFFKDSLGKADPRSSQPIPLTPDGQDLLEASPAATLLPDEADRRSFADYDALLKALRTCVERLSSQIDRQIIALLRDNLSHQEVGQRLQPPRTAGAVAVRVHRVSKKLHPCLVANGYDESRVRTILHRKGAE